ncbi:MAG TPA: metal-dependent hydrolase [Vicinamibacterales bacterium]|nr:metal-dependent hydrolase [Vicinamibacterales bacterium]
MDPISHVIFGRTLVALDRRGRFGAGAIAAAILGALAPDIDALAVWNGWDVYLRVHEIGTHSMLGSVAMGAAAGTLVYFLKRNARCAPLALAGTAGALSHIAFDIVSGAHIRLGWPIFESRASLPLVAMADPWLIAMCAIGTIGLWTFPRRQFVVATVVIGAIAAFLILKGVLMAAALPRWRAATSADTIGDHLVEASWSSLTEWSVADRTNVALRKWRVEAVHAPTLLLTIPLRADSPLIAASRSLDTVRNFLHVHDLGFAVATPLDQETLVLWSDIRYCSSSTECALWFGGVFDRNGRAVTQVVRVGQWQQIRAASP